MQKLILAGLALMLLIIAGCGQTGPLYLPPPNQPPQHKA